MTGDVLNTDDGIYPRFSEAEFSRRFGAVRAMMHAEGLAALLLYGSPHLHGEVQYLSNFRVAREALLVFPAMGEPALFVQFFNHVPTARRMASLSDVRWAGPNTADTAARDVRERGLAEQRLGLVGTLPWQHYETLRRELPSADLMDATAQMQRLRLIKSAEELAYLRRGAELTDRAMEALEREARPGITEHTLAAIVEAAYVGLGGQTSIHYMATTPMRQPEVYVPAQHPTDRMIQPGDVLITEISAQYHGYAGQIQRPYAIGAPPTPEYASLFAVAVTAFQRVAGAIRAGATADDVLNAAECIHEAGYTICDDLVHGFGGGYLPPIVRTRQTGASRTPAFRFEANMTIVIQPNVISPDDRAGLQVGELVRVTQSGVESLHRYPVRFIQCG
jgi:Xaa-Pro aminopeptidase